MWALPRRLWIKSPTGTCFPSTQVQTGRIFCICEQKQHKNRPNLKDHFIYQTGLWCWTAGPMWPGLRGSVGAIPQTDLPALPGLRPRRSPDRPNICYHHLAPYVGAFDFSKVLNCCSMWWTGDRCSLNDWLYCSTLPPMVHGGTATPMASVRNKWCEDRRKVSSIICELYF